MYQELIVGFICYCIAFKLIAMFFNKNRDSSIWNHIKKKLMGSRVFGTFIILLYFITFCIILLSFNNIFAQAIFGGIGLGFTKNFVSELIRR